MKVEEGKRRLRLKPVLCETCLCKVWPHQMGKHLVSHYHCRHKREGSDHLVLQYSASIVKQAPFQCQLCKFYCNTVQTFIAHWASEMHRQNDNQVAFFYVYRRNLFPKVVFLGICEINKLTRLFQLEGTYWCSFCKYATVSSMKMGIHLVGDQHREVVAVINHSVPIIIQKRVFVQCEVCDAVFRYNAQLRKHAMSWGHRQEKSTGSDEYQEVAACQSCPYRAHSLSSFQKHLRLKHGIDEGHYFCRVCNLRFVSAHEAKVHRREASHKHQAQFLKTKDKSSLARSCPHCGDVFTQLTLLKQHLSSSHPDQLHR